VTGSNKGKAKDKNNPQIDSRSRASLCCVGSLDIFLSTVNCGEWWQKYLILLAPGLISAKIGKRKNGR
jgi:hypothetical protein